MGRLNQRLMITPIGRIAGWRRLRQDKMAFSGLFHPYKRNKVGRHRQIRYLSYIEFDFIKHYPALSGHWEAHILGEREGHSYVLYDHEGVPTKGPML